MNEQQKSEPVALYSEAERRAVKTYVQNAVGPIERVYVEGAPKLVRVDVAVCPPTEERGVYTLSTIGMGARRMAVSQKDAERNRAFAELQLLLPADWDLERDNWPLRLLAATARHAYSPGGAIALGSVYRGAVPPESGFCAVLAAPAAVRDKLPPRVLLPGGKMVNYFLLIPLLPEEYRYLHARGSTFALFRRLAAVGGAVAASGRKSCVDEKNWLAEDIAPFVWSQDELGASVRLSDMGFCAARFSHHGTKPDGALWARTARACYAHMPHAPQESAPIFMGNGGVLWVGGADEAVLRRFILHLRDGCQTPALDTWIKEGMEETI